MSLETNKKETAAQLQEPPLEQSKPGALLCRARKEKGISVETVMLHLGVTEWTLLSLERDEYHKLPLPLYVKGYIKRYCTLVGLSSDELLLDFDKLASEVQSGKNISSIRLGDRLEKKRRPVKRYMGIAVFFFLVLALIFYVLSGNSEKFSWLTGNTTNKDITAKTASSGESESLETKVSQVQHSGPLVTPLFNNNFELDVLNAPQDTVEKEGVGELQNFDGFTEEHSTQIESSDRLGTEKNSKQTGQADKTNHVLNINVTNKNSWIEVIDGKGDILLADLKLSGYQGEVIGLAPFTVTLGNAYGVELVFNGQPVKIPSISDDNTVKFQIDEN